MHRTGYECALWELAKQVNRDRLAAVGLVGLWLAGWLALAWTVFVPLG